MNRHLERELERMRANEHKSNLLNPNTRREYFEYLAYKEWEEEQIARVRAGKPVIPYGRAKRRIRR